MQKQIHTLEELSAFAKDALATCTKKNTATVLALKGDLGAGKTAFVKELAKHLGITGEVTSPTFVIMKSYDILTHEFFKTLVHIDAYRIESDDEMRVLKLDAILKDNAHLICIEWPEKIQDCIPPEAHRIEFVLKADGSRQITYSE